MIDRLSVEDWKRFRAIRLRALADAPDSFARTHAEEAVAGSNLWRTRLTSGSATFAAVAGGRDVGLVTGAERSGRPGTAGLFGMWVAPERRRDGVGLALVHSVIDWARAIGFSEVSLEVADGNGPAIRLYEKAGFLPTGRISTLPPPREHITEHERSLTLAR